MTYLVLGAGMQGTAGAHYLGLFGEAQRIVIADIQKEAAEKAAERVNRLLGRNLCGAVVVDVRQEKSLVSALQGVHGVFSAVDYSFNEQITKVAIQMGCHLVDLGGNTDVVLAQLRLHEQAQLKGVSIIPDCGLAPGLGNTLAAYALERLDQTQSIQVRCGGLPQKPRPPLDYKLVFSIRGLTNEYFGKAWVIRNSQRVEIDTFSEKEELRFDAPVGECEAFVTTGGSSTCPWSFLGKLENFDYKTVRYKGHFEKVKCMMDLGLLDLKPVRVRSTAGEWVEIAPRELFHQVVPERIAFPEDKDLVVLRVTAEGVKNQKPMKIQYELLDFHSDQTGFTAMERSTSYPAAQVLIHAVKGLSKKGVVPLELALNHSSYLRDLSRSDLKIRGLSLDS